MSETISRRQWLGAAALAGAAAAVGVADAQPRPIADDLVRTVKGARVFDLSFTWNEALFASALTSQEASPFSALVLASRSTRGVDFNTAAVNTLIGIIPPVIFYFFVQRYLARGLSFGAVKG